MKKIFFLLFTIVSFSSAQDIPKQSSSGNPDGESISLHITPFFNSGALYSNDDLLGNYKSIVNFDVRIKIPFGKHLTFTPFYEQRNFDLYYKQSVPTKTLQVQTKAGMTVSIYF